MKVATFPATSSAIREVRLAAMYCIANLSQAK